MISQYSVLLHVLEALKSTFDELAELDVAAEYKMHPDLFLKTIMRIVRPHMNDVHGRYLRKQSSEHPFTFKDLQGTMRTYESNGYLDRTNGHAYTAAKNASTARAPNRRTP